MVKETYVVGPAEVSPGNLIVLCLIPDVNHCEVCVDAPHWLVCSILTCVYMALKGTILPCMYMALKGGFVRA